MENFPINIASGLQKYDSFGAVKVDAFRIDAGVQAAGTATTKTYKAGSIIWGFVAKVTEAVTSDGAATAQLGFTGTTQLSAAIAKATLVQNYFFGVANDIDASPLVLSADDTFDSIVAVATLTSGKFDVYIVYTEPPTADLADDYTKEYTTA